MVTAQSSLISRGSKRAEQRVMHIIHSLGWLRETMEMVFHSLSLAAFRLHWCRNSIIYHRKFLREELLHALTNSMQNSCDWHWLEVEIMVVQVVVNKILTLTMLPNKKRTEDFWVALKRAGRPKFQCMEPNLRSNWHAVLARIRFHRTKIQHKESYLLRKRRKRKPLMITLEISRQPNPWFKVPEFPKQKFLWLSLVSITSRLLTEA